MYRRLLAFGRFSLWFATRATPDRDADKVESILKQYFGRGRAPDWLSEQLVEALTEARREASVITRRKEKN